MELTPLSFVKAERRARPIKETHLTLSDDIRPVFLGAELPFWVSRTFMLEENSGKKRRDGAPVRRYGSLWFSRSKRSGWDVLIWIISISIDTDCSEAPESSCGGIKTDNRINYREEAHFSCCCPPLFEHADEGCCFTEADWNLTKPVKYAAITFMHRNLTQIQAKY